MRCGVKKRNMSLQDEAISEKEAIRLGAVPFSHPCRIGSNRVKDETWIIRNMIADLELRSKVRTNDLVWPRACCMFIARDAGYTLQFIADWWDRDHGTVHHAVELVNDLREQKPAYDKQFRRFAFFSKNYIQRKDGC